jgi:hypothetical protein
MYSYRPSAFPHRRFAASALFLAARSEMQGVHRLISAHAVLKSIMDRNMALFRTASLCQPGMTDQPMHFSSSHPGPPQGESNSSQRRGKKRKKDFPVLGWTVIRQAIRTVMFGKISKALPRLVPCASFRIFLFFFPTCDFQHQTPWSGVDG